MKHVELWMILMVLIAMIAPAHAQTSDGDKPLYLIPMPHDISRHDGALTLPADVRVYLDPVGERPEHLAALRIVELLGKDAQLHRASINQEPESGHIVLAVVESPSDDVIESQGYTLTINGDGARVEGNSVVGLYHGMQTLRQLIEQFGHELPMIEINDQPDFEWRGFYHDISRGKVPTLDTMKEIVDYIADRKMNMFQLYVEHPFTFRFNPEIARDGDGMTHQEVLELQEYARDRRVMLVPSLQSFGHMAGILSMDEYRHLADVELDRPWGELTWHERMWGATLDVSNDESRELLTMMHEEYNALHDAPFSNVCADETYDLGKGKTKELTEERGTGRVYLDHIEWLNELTKSHGKRMMFWGDIVKQHPDLVSEIPKDTILLNWGYFRNTDYESSRLFQEAGLDFFVCPGTSGWRRIINAVDNANINIRRYAEAGKRYGAMGLLNTDWGDYGHYNLLAGSLHGIALGAEVSWNVDGSDTEEFNRIWSWQTFGDDNTDVINALFELSAFANDHMTWLQMYSPFDADVYATLMGDGPERLERFAREGMAALDAARSNPGADQLAIDELYHGCRMLVLLAEKGTLLQHLAADDQPDNLDDQLNRWADRVLRQQSDYDRLWLARNKPSELFKIQEAVGRVALEAREIAKGLNAQ